MEPVEPRAAMRREKGVEKETARRTISWREASVPTGEGGGWDGIVVLGEEGGGEGGAAAERGGWDERRGRTGRGAKSDIRRLGGL